MRILKYCVLLFIAIVPMTMLAEKNEKSAYALVERLLPAVSDCFIFQEIDDDAGKDVFEIESIDGKICIRGNSANSMAVGLNYYLKYYCHTTVSWYADDPVELPAELPSVNQKVRVKARMDKRFFLNYCTFGYTMAWWQWRDWERLIDWMALNGVNMPLAITGQEAIWLRVWKKLGLDEKDIKNYFTGPAHLAWHRMTNFDYFQGPLPDSYLEHQEKLQKRIVTRERELNMKPILPAFAGHVPEALIKIHPESKINRMSMWGGFQDKYRSFFLDPLDPLFPVIQKAFLEEQTRLYGTDHIYGADPFNEIQSPSWDPEYLATVSRTIYNTITQVDKEASWLQMTWLFYFDSEHWTGPRIDAFVNGVPKNKMILLDYYAENTEIWKLTKSYYGQPYLWCYLGNFGGNTMMTGNLRETGKRIENAFINGGKNFWGIGSTLESFDVNPFMYEYVFEKAWENKLDDDQWMESLADRRFGSKCPEIRKAWSELLNKVYIANAHLGQGALTNARPTLKGYGNWTTNPKIAYSNKDLFQIWELMLKGKDSSKRDSYVFDVVNIGRQVISNYFLQLRDEFTLAYEQKNKEEVMRKGLEMLELLSDLDMLLSCHSTFSFGRWICAAEVFGKDAAEKEYYKKNARTLLTTWGERGQSLNDYANRSWAGLTKSYYTPRWQAFVYDVCKAMEENREFDEKVFREKMLDMEADWMEHDFVSSDVPRKDGVMIAFSLMKKYKAQIMK